MKVAATTDWRDAIAFETPRLVADVYAGEPTRCSVCGVDSQPRPRTELWAVKHRHPKHHGGHVRFYCREHLPTIAAPSAQEQARATTRAPRAARRAEPAPRGRRVVERAVAVCPDCFVEIPATGVCGMCGRPAD